MPRVKTVLSIGYEYEELPSEYKSLKYFSEKSWFIHLNQDKFLFALDVLKGTLGNLINIPFSNENEFVFQEKNSFRNKNTTPN